MQEQWYYFFIQNVAYNGIDLMLFSNPKLRCEILIEYLGLYFPIYIFKLLDLLFVFDFTSIGIISSFILTKPFEEVEKDFRAQCEFLKGCGSKRIGVSEQSYSIQGQMETPVFEKKYVMNEDEWVRFADGLFLLI